jgi:hypothetical protein
MFAARGIQRFQTGGSMSTFQKQATKILGSAMGMAPTNSSSFTNTNTNINRNVNTSTSNLEFNYGMRNTTSRMFSAPAAAYNQTVDTFPSIVIGSDGTLSAQGPFAESQAQVSDFVSIHFDI